MGTLAAHPGHKFEYPAKIMRHGDERQLNSKLSACQLNTLLSIVSILSASLAQSSI